MTDCRDGLGRVIVTGASSQVGRFLLPRLRAAGFAVSALSRRPQPPASGVDWLQADLEQFIDWSPAAGARALIHAAEITLVQPQLMPLARLGVRRVIAFSSTSRLTKQDSADPAERRLAQFREKQAKNRYRLPAQPVQRATQNAQLSSRDSLLERCAFCVERFPLPASPPFLPWHPPPHRSFLRRYSQKQTSRK